jgi:hypothetical protein
MSTINASFSRDNNRVPVTTDGITVSVNKLMTGDGTTVAVPLFHIVGAVEIRGLWGEIVTALQNHTAAHWRINDQTATSVVITAASGTALTNKTAGSLIVKKDLLTAALTLIDNAAGVISEPTTKETTFFSPFVAVQKTGSITTDIEYVYTTSDSPTTGEIKFNVRWLPLTSNANVVAI